MKIFIVCSQMESFACLRFYLAICSLLTTRTKSDEYKRVWKSPLEMSQKHFAFCVHNDNIMHSRWRYLHKSLSTMPKICVMNSHYFFQHCRIPLLSENLCNNEFIIIHSCPLRWNDSSLLVLCVLMSVCITKRDENRKSVFSSMNHIFKHAPRRSQWWQSKPIIIKAFIPIPCYSRRALHNDALALFVLRFLLNLFQVSEIKEQRKAL